MEKSIVIQLYQFIANYTAYRHLYGHLILHSVRATNSSQSDTLQVNPHFLVKHPPNNKIIDLIDGRQRSIVHNYKGLNRQSIVQIQ